MSESPYQTSMSSEQLTTSLQGGQPLGSDVKSSFESRYGHSLSHVRVHTDAKSSSLCNQFGARAFAFRNHIAFGQGMYQPHTSEGTRLLRHELTHVLHDGPRDGGTVKRAALCAGTCPPAGALPWAPLTNTTFNCYSYALNSPASLMLQPGQKSGSSEWTDLHSPDPAKRAAAAATYFTPAGVLRNVTSDLGAPVSTNCDTCCSSPKRKIIAVATDALASVGIGHYDFHWYRKDADGPWSHKRGRTPAERNDAAGTFPICNPCNASRSYAGHDYKNVIGSWCV
jgi:hypothetical protein